MHRAGPLGLGEGHGRHGLERHPALRAWAGTNLAHLRVHRARVLARVSVRVRARFARLRAQVGLGRGLELVEAALAAEVIRLATMRHLTDGICRENAHPADGIDDFRLDDGAHGRHGRILGAGHAAGP